MWQNSNRKLRLRASRGVELSCRLGEVKGEATLFLSSPPPQPYHHLRFSSSTIATSFLSCSSTGTASRLSVRTLLLSFLCGRYIHCQSSRLCELSHRPREVKGEATLPADASYPADLEKLGALD